jgi:hypothetical protein
MTSAALRLALEQAARRQRLRTSGRPGRASIVAARSTGVLQGMAALIEFELELIGADGEPARRVTVVEPVPLVLASHAVAGTEVDVFVADGTDDGVLIEWSA